MIMLAELQSALQGEGGRKCDGNEVQQLTRLNTKDAIVKLTRASSLEVHSW